MKEFLGFTTNVPIAVQTPLSKFLQLSYEKGKLSSGWGGATYQNSFPHTFHECKKAFESRFFFSLKDVDIKTTCLLASLNRQHYLYRPDDLSTLMPFRREIGEKTWTFVQAGDVEEQSDLQYSTFKPAGPTIAEKVFCQILESIVSIRKHDGNNISEDIISFSIR